MTDAGSQNLVIFQKAAAAAQALDDEARLAIAEYLFAQESGSGLFKDRKGEPDVYYTFFALAALISLKQEPNIARLQKTLRSLPAEDLDLIHLSCLVRLHLWCNVLSLMSLKRLHKILLSFNPLYQAGSKALRLMQPPDKQEKALLAKLETFRTPDGGFAMKPGATVSNPYAAFLAWQTYADAGVSMPESAAVLRSIETCRARDGAFASAPDLAHGTTPVTAAVLLLQQALGEETEQRLYDWLRGRWDQFGGFYAGPDAPVPDLLSTGVSLFTLSRLGHQFCPCERDPATDFVTLHWNDDGGFCGTLTDPRSDCEYTFYGLLALGCLA